jgi:hypothetical protein
MDRTSSAQRVTALPETLPQTIVIQNLNDRHAFFDHAEVDHFMCDYGHGFLLSRTQVSLEKQTCPSLFGERQAVWCSRQRDDSVLSASANKHYRGFC